MGRGTTMENFKKTKHFNLNTFKNFSLHIVPSKNGIKINANEHRGLLCSFVEERILLGSLFY